MTTDTSTRIALPGGEMLAWSDLTGRRLPGGGPLAALAARVTPAGARVLLAGPHDPELVDRLAHADVTCLLRSWPDGSALAEDRPVRVVVGGPGGLPADETFDVVIAAAGLDAVESVEGTPVGWDGLLRRLAAVLAPGGTLLLRLDNPVGLTRLVDTAPWYAGRDDADWAIGGALDAGRPANTDQLRDRLAAAGLRPGGCFAAYPEPDAPTALVDASALAAHPGSGLLDAVLHGACAPGRADRPVLQDPARLAVDALHAGLGAALAPGWLVLAHRAASAVPAAGDPPDPAGTEPGAAGTGGLPVLWVQSGPPGFGVVEVTAAADGWRWRVPGPVAAATDAPFATRAAAWRDPAVLTGAVPEGRLLRTVLLDACLRRDLAALRRLLRGYAAWLDAHADDAGRLTGATALASLDNVVLTGGGAAPALDATGAAPAFAVLDPSWRASDPWPLDVTLARGLWRFAATLATGGYAHPWSSTLDVAGLTVVLAGTAGRDLDRATVTAAVDAEVAVTAALRGLDGAARVALADELRAVEPTAPPAGLDSHQQLREAWRRQKDELTRLTALLRWTEELLTSRERALRRAEATINLLSGSISYRVGRLAITPARLAKRGARAAKRRAKDALAPRRDEQEQQ
ncbi:class I SAM-dependent methyltransferase [Micromonospora sp. NPDC002575]|uniref:class I SAM-dependent methyltransferase n=1 Tax=Micromonospora sp. NPDC002575 TaxID=3364222 RepID=UPI0036844456